MFLSVTNLPSRMRTLKSPMPTRPSWTWRMWRRSMRRLSRGSCSSKKTHPYFLSSIEDVFIQVPDPLSHCPLLCRLRPHIPSQFLLLHQDPEAGWADGCVQAGQDDRWAVDIVTICSKSLLLFRSQGSRQNSCLPLAWQVTWNTERQVVIRLTIYQ